MAKASSKWGIKAICLSCFFSDIGTAGFTWAQDGIRAIGEDFQPVEESAIDPFPGLDIDASEQENNNSVREYSGGVVFTASASEMSKLAYSNVRSLDKTALTAAFHALNIKKLDVGSLTLELELENRLEVQELTESPTEPRTYIIQFVQRINGYSAGQGTATIEVMDEESKIVSFSGVLVDPTLPQLQPENWIDGKTAKALAIEGLTPLASERASSWFVKSIEDGTAKGEVEIQVDANFDNVSARAVYRMRGDGGIALVDLYTGEVEVHPILRPNLTSDVKTNVCTLAGVISCNTCINSSSQASTHTQAHI